MAVLALLWKAFGTLGWLARIAVIVLPLLGGFLAFTSWKKAIWQEGYDAAIAKIAAEDAATIQRATAARNKYTDCRARRGTWDMTTGECK